MGLEASVDHPWWAWYVNGGDTLLAGGMSFPMESGWYRVESVSSLGCPLASDSLLVCWPLEAPEVVQDAAGDLVIEGDFASVQWWEGATELEGETGLVLTNPGEGSYSVWVTDFADCPASQSESWEYVGLVKLSCRLGAWCPILPRVSSDLEPEWWGGTVHRLDAQGGVWGAWGVSLDEMGCQGVANGVHIFRLVGRLGRKPRISGY